MNFIQGTGISLQQRFLGYQRRDINGIFEFFDTLQNALLTNVKRAFVNVCKTWPILLTIFFLCILIACNWCVDDLMLMMTTMMMMATTKSNKDNFYSLIGPGLGQNSWNQHRTCRDVRFYAGRRGQSFCCRSRSNFIKLQFVVQCSTPIRHNKIKSNSTNVLTNVMGKLCFSQIVFILFS